MGAILSEPYRLQKWTIARPIFRRAEFNSRKKGFLLDKRARWAQYPDINAAGE